MDTGGLLWLYDNIDVFLLVMIRLVGFFVILPVFAGSNIPTAVRVGAAFLIAAAVFAKAEAGADIAGAAAIEYAVIALKEFAVGFCMAFAVYAVFSAFYLIGQLADFQIGFSMVSVFDPGSSIQVPITGNLFYLMVLAFFIETGGLGGVIRAVAESFSVLPIGSADIIGNGRLLETAVSVTSHFLVFGVRASLPVVGTVFIVDIALGLLTKAVPQMNVFVVGMPIKLMAGLAVLYLVMPAFYGLYQSAYDSAMNYMARMLRGLM
ncbi:MAG: flagellar biosynthetic protein FliR [Clostridiales bacterium]|jgi:flagellar biosynthetic protein FliR|nr:flagellar biosynthetic protein FliR [Clostridiales bacterium]